jgi:CBS domain containing-hemolysin-like protein
MNWLTDARDLVVALLLVGLNGFFVAAEFSLVKVRGNQLDVLGAGGSLAGRVARWLGKRLDASLSAWQLGITMASFRCAAARWQATMHGSILPRR